jgi:hypothetical protein
MFRAQERVVSGGSAASAARRVVAVVCVSLAALLTACGDDATPESDAGSKTDGGNVRVVVEKMIDPEVGGTIELPDGPVLTIPPGSLPAGSTVKVTVETTTDSGPQGTASKVYQFGPEGLKFEKPVPVSIPFDLKDRNGDEYTIFWSKLGAAGYEDLPTEFADGKASTMVDHFSSCGVRRKPTPVTCNSDTSTARDTDDDSVVDNCACKDGFELRGGSCVDIDECAKNNGGCDEKSVCTNTPGGRSCGKCPSGYEGTGDTKCVDFDECGEKNGGCDATVVCTNTPGSFTCGKCPTGFTGGGASGC